MVTHFSTSGRTSLALCSVVVTRPLTFGAFGSNSASRSVKNKLLAKLRNIARRWLGERPRIRPRRRCRMATVRPICAQ